MSLLQTKVELVVNLPKVSRFNCFTQQMSMLKSPNNLYLVQIHLFESLKKFSNVTFQMKTQSALDFSNTDISNYFLHQRIYILDWHFSFFHLHFNSCNFKLLISQSKFSGSRKCIFRYQ